MSPSRSPTTPESVPPVGPPSLFGPRRQRSLAFLRRVVVKSEEDGIFFMAGAISFNVLVAVVPLLLFAVGVGALVVASRFGDPQAVLITFLLENLPVLRGDEEVAGRVASEIGLLLEEGRSLTILGAALLVWFSARLVATLRTVLREIFDIGQARGIVWGKVFDILVVLIGGALFTVNLGITAVLRVGRDYGVSLLGIEGQALGAVQRWSTQGLAVVAIWILFLGIYRFLPARAVPWRTAVIAATFTTVVHEVLKFGFGWYVSEFANYRSAYGNLLSLAVVFFWIYYEAIGFILGGEVAQVWTMREARRVQIREVMSGAGRTAVLLAAALFTSVLAAGPAELAAQAPALQLDGEETLYEERILERGIETVTPVMPDHEGRYVVVHLAENRVFVFEGGRAIWSAPAGTGTGFRLETGEHSWDFATPRGLFKVRKMERDPIWEAPDWHWIERGLTPPPADSPARRIRGGMGNTAVYLGDGIAIHGTERPQLLLNPDPDARRVSHGCIRLTNESARELMHLIDVGTPVLVY